MEEVRKLTNIAVESKTRIRNPKGNTGSSEYQLFEMRRVYKPAKTERQDLPIFNVEESVIVQRIFFYLRGQCAGARAKCDDKEHMNCRAKFWSGCKGIKQVAKENMVSIWVLPYKDQWFPKRNQLNLHHIKMTANARTVFYVHSCQLASGGRYDAWCHRHKTSFDLENQQPDLHAPVTWWGLTGDRRVKP